MIHAAQALFTSSFISAFVSAVILGQEDQFTLAGRHLRVTAKDEVSFLSFGSDDGVGNVTGRASGYLADMLQAISERANFTFEMHTPSGLGSHCSPQVVSLNSTDAYNIRYTKQFDCGADDVNELQGSDAGTDIYLVFSPPRQRLNDFTVPFSPPFKGTPAMYGTMTGLQNIHELANQQDLGRQPSACVLGSSAVPDFLRDSFQDPPLLIREFFGSDSDAYEAMGNGTCPVMIFDAPLAAAFVRKMSETGRCHASNGKPIGIIGEPMEFGLSHYAIGVGKHLESNVVDTLSFWIHTLMSKGVLAELYEGHGGTGRECGYELFPTVAAERLLNDGQIVASVLVPIAVVLTSVTVFHRYSLKRQERRYKTRFVQQIARNIDIGPSPGHISPEKLSEEVLHIGHGKGVINKEDLRTWLSDVKMDFLSEKGFEALWDAIDVDDTGFVDAVEFIVFLSACGPEFTKVYEAQQKLPKLERLKLAARRLSNIGSMGEEGVRRMQNRLERTSAGYLPSGSLANESSSASFRSMDVSQRLQLLDDCKRMQREEITGADTAEQ